MPKNTYATARALSIIISFLVARFSFIARFGVAIFAVF
jgi:hypothetical protein